MKALQALSEVLAIPNPSAIERDAAIQRFEFSCETAWKAAKQVLFDREGIDEGSPKGVIRSCRSVGILDADEAQLALQMIDDRNLTVHTYNEPLAQQIYNRLFAYRDLLIKWTERLKENR